MRLNLWVTEENAEVGYRMGFQVTETLYEAQSDFQHIHIVDTVPYGRMLLLDNCVMTTERDEFVYHEMISHMPLCLIEWHQHQQAKQAEPLDVLVIGGGDGGTIREILRHPQVRRAVLCEIDGLVIDSCRQYLPSIACALDDPKVDIQVRDGIAYIAEQQSAFDLIIVDSTDPIGPGEGLFTEAFYKNVAKALKPHGMVVAQTESPILQQANFKRAQECIGSGFKQKVTYVGTIPTYPGHLWSWTAATNNPDFNLEAFLEAPRTELTAQFGKTLAHCQYLNPALLQGAFALPNFVQALLKQPAAV